RIVNRTSARLHIGEQVPIKMSSSLFRDSSEELSSYEYRDVGIVLNLTPKILSESELSLDLKLEVSTILHASEDGHPTIGTREVETTLRLQDGQVEVIAGLLKDEERKGTTRIPLLGDMPVLGRLFASETSEGIQTDIIVSLTPHIMDRRIMTAQDRSLWQGQGTGSRKSYKISSRKSDKSQISSVKGLVLDSDENQTDSGGYSETSDGDNETSDSEPKEGFVLVAVEPDKTSMAPGDASEIKVVIRNANNVGSVPFYIDYDPNVIEIISVREGAFMGSDGVPTAFMSSVNERRGRIIIGLSRIGAVGGISGSGDLVEIVFRGDKIGQSPLAFSHEAVLGPAAENIPAHFSGGTVDVAAAEKQ
ncbi:hypothetical protein K8T06_14715, partial [bacterium]|nr:hypothetical protein [bacterium]